MAQVSLESFPGGKRISYVALVQQDSQRPTSYWAADLGPHTSTAHVKQNLLHLQSSSGSGLYTWFQYLLTRVQHSFVVSPGSCSTFSYYPCAIPRLNHDRASRTGREGRSIQGGTVGVAEWRAARLQWAGAGQVRKDSVSAPLGNQTGGRPHDQVLAGCLCSPVVSWSVVLGPALPSQGRQTAQRRSLLAPAALTPC